MKLIINIFFGFIVFFYLPSAIYALDACNTSCPSQTGDADLGVNFTGLQPGDIDPDNPAKRITITLTAASTPPSSVSCSRNAAGYCTCDYPSVGDQPSGTAGYTASCNAYNNSGNIECQVRHLDCRNAPFNYTIIRPANYTCAVTSEPDGPVDSSIGLNNCSANGALVINCSAPTSRLTDVICKVYNGNTTTSTCLSSGGISGITINSGSTVTWCTDRSGGTGTYSYSWSGDDSLSGTTQSVTKTYSTTGNKTASVVVSSGTATAVTASCPTVTVNAACTCSSTDNANYCSSFSYTNSCGASCTGSKTCSSGQTCSTASTPHSCVPTSTPRCEVITTLASTYCTNSLNKPIGKDVSATVRLYNIPSYAEIGWKLNNNMLDDPSPLTATTRNMPCVGFTTSDGTLETKIKSPADANLADPTTSPPVIATCSTSFSNPPPGSGETGGTVTTGATGNFVSLEFNPSCGPPYDDNKFNVGVTWTTSDNNNYPFNHYKAWIDYSYLDSTGWECFKGADTTTKDYSCRWDGDIPGGNTRSYTYTDLGIYNGTSTTAHNLRIRGYTYADDHEASSPTTNWILSSQQCPPDLIIVTNPTFSPTNPILGNNMTFQGTVKEQGWGLNAPSSTTRLYIKKTDNPSDTSFHQVPLDKDTGALAYTTGEEIEEWTGLNGTNTNSLQTTGAYAFKICANTTNLFSEVSYVNNCSAEVPFTISPPPLPTVVLKVRKIGQPVSDCDEPYECNYPSSSPLEIILPFGATTTQAVLSGNISGANFSACPIQAAYWSNLTESWINYFIRTNLLYPLSLSFTSLNTRDMNANRWRYTMTCANAGGSASDSVYINVINSYDPWIQADGDVHSNTKIDLSGGPP